MLYKTIEFEGREWMWPADDTKLLQVNDWLDDLRQALTHLNPHSYRTAIQAGGACGVWPVELAKYFETVYTFEPVLENYICLACNVFRNSPLLKIIPMHCGLGSTPYTAVMHRDKFEDGNAGAWYVGEEYETGHDARTIPIVTIDNFGLTDVDFIQLDVEGLELQGLEGAARTIEKYHPVIMLENKQLPHMKESATLTINWLAQRGYKPVGKYHRDVVMVYTPL